MLSTDLVFNIINYLPIKNKIYCIFLNKRFYNYYNKYIRSILTIQHFYKNNRPNLPPEPDKWSGIIERKYNKLFTKKLLVRHYIAHYPMRYLLIYPEFLINKLQKPNLLQWLVENSPDTVEKRTRRDIRNFLMLDNITKEDILYTGW